MSAVAPRDAIRFAVLGRVRVWRGGVELDPGTPQQRALLAILLARTGHPVGRDEAARLLWADAPPDSASNLVHRYVGQLRRLLEPGLTAREEGRWLLRGSGGYRLLVTADTCDLVRFRALAERGRGAERDGRTEQAVAAFVEAFALWHGPAGDGSQPTSGARELFAALDRECVAVACVAADLALAGGNADRILEPLQQCAQWNPLDEALHARLIRVLTAAGRPSEALAAFELINTRLADKLGVDPGRELRAALGDAGAEAAAPPPLVRPAQLPADLAVFAGRRDDLARVLALLPEDGPSPGPVVISAIGGMGGIGKTTLAVHWAHRVAPRFPDGQLYVNLRGFDAEREVLDPADVVRGFLEALGVLPHEFPADAAAQTALYRSLLARRRVLIVLDNARDAEQVRPLLPGNTPGCLVVVTSRDAMVDLVAAEGAHPVKLDLFGVEEAGEVLARRLGAARVAAEPAAVAEIVELCAGLPLALAIVAAHAATHPGFSLAAIAAELRQHHGGLDGFEVNPSRDVRTVFSWSYRALGAEAARMFRLLAVHPGPDVTVLAAASIAALAASRARIVLAELTRAHLLTERVPGRYTVHDLLRAYAIELSADDDERQAALERLLDHYVHTAHAATLVQRPYRHALRLQPPAAGVVLPQLDDQRQAMSWFATELPVLLAVVPLSEAAGAFTYTWQLAWGLDTYLVRQGRWDDWIAIQQTALAAARQSGEVTGQAHAHRSLGSAALILRRNEEAHRHLDQALALFREMADRYGQARVHQNIASLATVEGRPDDALRHEQQALELYRADGDQHGQATSLNNLGYLHSLLGDPERALEHGRQGLALLQELGDRHTEAITLDSIGLAHQGLGQHREAVDCYERSVALFREHDDRREEARTLARLGAAHLSLGEVDMARDAWRRSLEIFTKLGHPDADDVRARLDGLDHRGVQ